jgi:hypothetical protein
MVPTMRLALAFMQVSQGIEVRDGKAIVVADK